MEPPSTWRKTERVIQDAYKKWWEANNRGVYGFSMAKLVADALRREGLINEDADEPAAEPKAREKYRQGTLWEDDSWLRKPVDEEERRDHR